MGIFRRIFPNRPLDDDRVGLKFDDLMHPDAMERLRSAIADDGDGHTIKPPVPKYPGKSQ